MGFAAGFQAGSTAVERGLAVRERKDRMKREAEDRARQDAARDSYHKLQEDYYSGQGDFAPNGAPADPQAAAMADASYDRLEGRRMGLQVPEVNQAPMADSAGMQQPRGLSLDPQQMQGAAPQPMSQQAKDALYYRKLAEWGQTNLDPDKATAFMGEVTRLKETNYQQRRLDAFRAASSGDRSGLDTMGELFSGMVPAGTKVDTSKAVFDPAVGWTGIKVGDKDVTLDDKMMAGLFMRSDPAQLLEYKLKMGQEQRADKADTRADRGMGLQERASDRDDTRLGLAVNADKRDETKLGLAVNADGREERFTDAKIRGINADIRQGDARLSIARQAEAISAGRLKLEEQRMILEKDIKAGDEKARDLLTRQETFMSSYGFSGKLDPNSLTYEQDQRRAEAGKQLAGLATAIYGMSAEGAKPGERNAIHAETDQFIRAFDAGKLDRKRLKDNGDGTMSYGRIKFPSTLMDSDQPAPAAAATPEKKGVKVEKKKSEKRGLQIPAAPAADPLEGVSPELGFAP